MFTKDDNGNYHVDTDGIHYLAAFKMAVDDINSGMYPELNIKLNITVKGTTVPFIDDVKVLNILYRNDIFLWFTNPYFLFHKASLYQNTDAFAGRAIHGQIAGATNIGANAAGNQN